MREYFWKRKKSILKKIVSFFLTLLCISIFTFLIVKLQPGDPAINYLRSMKMGITQESIENARIFLNLDKPVFLQFIHWIGRALQGDLGISYSEKEPVIGIIVKSSLSTFKLGSLSFILLLVLSLWIGITGALYQGKFIDKFIKMISYIFVSLPTFWLGYLLIIIFSVHLRILPVSGMKDISSYWLPAITLMIPLSGQTGLFIRKNIISLMGQSHVENAIMRGVDKKYIILNHLMRNASIPIVTVLSANIIYLITGSVLIEEIFSWPGLGRMFVDAVRNNDLPLIQGSLLLFGVLAIVINTLTQELVYFMDPNTRMERRMSENEEK